MPVYIALLSHLIDLAEICLSDCVSPLASVVPWTTFPPSPTTPTHRGAAESSSKPTKSSRTPAPPNRAASEIQNGLEAAGRRRRKRRKQAPVVAKSSGAAAAAAAAGVPAMITRSKLVEQLRDYQIRSQHKRDIIGAISWGLLCCFLIISSYMTLYFRHFWLSAIIISVGILLPAGLYILRQRKLAKKRERRLLLPLSM
ncbi:uncharacterized protein LOC101777013 [Setaria italica]|uniref:uncharacterized protein LOC101777013 n=1 Tax=Setaria italica TaxID=4555 RepID=UPI000BE5B751|nr:uncharacterized protein LOC101777013 [Setaria italica]